LDLRVFDMRRWNEGDNDPPNTPKLSGLPLEYRIVQLYSRDAGKREAKIAFDIGQGTADLSLRNQASLLFDCLPSADVTLRVRDENGAPTMALFLIRDKQGRAYPSQVKRLAPDFWFHPQVYRADGEKVRLPKGEYTVEYGRGPEYLVGMRSFTLQRWIDPSKFGWWSGDHHIHAAGCAHYTVPSQGVLPSDRIRHCLGALKYPSGRRCAPSDCENAAKHVSHERDSRFSRLRTPLFESLPLRMQASALRREEPGTQVRPQDG